MKELKVKLEEVKKNKEWLAVTLSDYKVLLNSANLYQEVRKSLARVSEFKQTEQEQIDIWAGTKLVHKATNEGITNAIN